MSKKQVATVEITAKQARRYGMPALFKRGHVHEVTCHTGQPIVVRNFIGAKKGQAIIRDKHGKQRPVSFTSIKTMKVPGHLAKEIQG